MLSMLAFVSDPCLLAQASEGYNLPLNESLLALMPMVAAIVFALGKVEFIEKNKALLLPVLAVAVSVGAAFLTGQPDPVQVGIGLGAATAYAYDFGKGVVATVRKTQ